MLDDYLTRARPWVWGESDCTIWVADWCVIHFGFDPAIWFRGGYSTEAEALDLTRDGLAALIGPHMAPLREVTTPQAGDVGVIRVAGHEVAAIWTGSRWAFRTRRGLGEAPARAIRIWGRGCQQ